MNTQFSVPVDHPALPGHFPGRPLVPGVVILDEVIAAARAAWPALTFTGVANAKFLAPLLPDQVCDCLLIRLSKAVEFECQVGQTPIARGRLRIEAATGAAANG